MPTDSIVFDHAAEFYDETRGFPVGVARPVAATIARIAKLNSDSTVLDVGVGTGRVAVPLAPHVGYYAGIDLAVPMMEQLRKKPAGNLVKLVQGDVTQLPFASNCFDAVVATHIFHLIPTWENALKEVARVLKPEGKLINCYGDSRGRRSMQPLWDIWNTVIPAERRQRVGADFENNPDFLKNHGWQFIEGGVYEYEATTSVTRFLDLIRRRVWSRLWYMDQNDIDHGLQAMEAFVTEHIDDPDEPLIVESTFRVEIFIR